ncbi:hypothetical protein FK535_06965 [Mycolicibacterium sp. 018/SC-01/001]|uniref:hypothetical protein n=1 Tax=Mycolicibacterium sp. 018/SC-01/001 TaxID=2592069 RepID=UPI00117F5E19|nr:hypothetical protein [Mycolicibacterium sp. 018/SC-01/001]TRW86206.1 hypothetical protein FK535_06965 [Mycolicibacterium sp. 018/SC-01/001]
MPYVDTELVISAVPAGGHRQFAEGTTLYLAVAPDTRDVNSDDVQVAPHEVSGRETVDLIKLAPAGVDAISVRRIGGEDTPLPALANRARVACRGALGVDAFGAALDITVGCVVDTSASMARMVADGTLDVAIDIFAGLAAAVSGDQPVRTVLAGRDVTDVAGGSLAELRTRVRDAMAANGFGIGADIDSAVDRISETVQHTVVITDAPSRTVPGYLGVGWINLIGSGDRTTGFDGAVLPPPSQGVSAESFYHANPHLIDAAVAALVAPLRAATR